MGCGRPNKQTSAPTVIKNIDSNRPLTLIAPAATSTSNKVSKPSNQIPAVSQPAYQPHYPRADPLQPDAHYELGKEVELTVVDLRKELNCKVNCSLGQNVRDLFAHVRRQTGNPKKFLLSYGGRVILENSDKSIGDYGIAGAASLVCFYEP